MPKNRDTRAQRAAELRRRIVDGPVWSDLVALAISDADEVTRQYRLWVNRWIVHELDYLVPELWRALRDKRTAAEHETTAAKGDGAYSARGKWTAMPASGVIPGSGPGGSPSPDDVFIIRGQEYMLVRRERMSS